MDERAQRDDGEQRGQQERKPLRPQRIPHPEPLRSDVAFDGVRAERVQDPVDALVGRRHIRSARERREDQVLGRIRIEHVEPVHRHPRTLSQPGAEADVGEDRDADDGHRGRRLTGLNPNLVSDPDPEGPRGLLTQRHFVGPVRPASVPHRRVHEGPAERLESPREDVCAAARASDIQRVLEIAGGHGLEPRIPLHRRDRLVLEAAADVGVPGCEREVHTPQPGRAAEMNRTRREPERTDHRRNGDRESDHGAPNGDRCSPVPGLESQA